MTQADKLQALMQRAKDNGWDVFGKVDNYYECGKCDQHAAYGSFVGEYDSDDGGKWHHKTKVADLPFEYDESWLVGWTDEKGDYRSLQFSVNDIIFNHDFARSLWPEKIYEKAVSAKETVWDEDLRIPASQYHLQQAVIADDRIGYMYGAVFDD